MSSVITVARFTLTAWTRETAGQLRLPGSTVKVFAALSVVGAVAFGTILALMVSGTEGALQLTLTPGSLSFMLGGSFLTIAFLTTLFSVLGPSRNCLATVLEMLPVSRRAVFVGLQIPVLALSYILSFSLCIPSLAVLWRSKVDWWSAAVASILLVAFLASAQLLILTLFQSLGFGFRRWLRLPRYYASSFAGVCCFAASILLVWVDALPLPESMADTVEAPRNFAMHRVWGRTLAPLWTGVPLWWLDFVLALLWLVIPLGLMLLVARLDVDNQEDVTLRLFANAPFPRNHILAAAYIDGMQLLRSHQFMVLVLLLAIGLGGVVTLGSQPDLRLFAAAAAPSLAIAPCFIGMQSYGLTSRTHWLQRHLTARANAWAAPKIIACATISFAIGVLFVGALFAAGLLTAEQWPRLIPDAVLAWTAAMIGGVLVPFSREQPLASGATGFTIFLIYCASSSAARWAGAQLGKQFGDVAYLGEAIASVPIGLIQALALGLVVMRVSKDV
ncbi:MULTISPECIES: hypothetical protein [Arthrobacter]|uniref:Uncharacterized protein n=1 Tax=Arthrobacter terricola TaxID=2547396 RepID=A0A4R5KEK3_9MICC|nr:MULTISPECIES: hypothetical protein [Arthrobacter]MBT8162475.1 hypothetical protein [Arthrobacter sp. GN70]TDF93105.1 hypothetical protein E1809_16635 [Arthrobacter terricola]